MILAKGRLYRSMEQSITENDTHTHTRSTDFCKRCQVNSIKKDNLLGFQQMVLEQ